MMASSAVLACSMAMVVGDEEEGVKLMVNVIDAFQEEFGELDGRDLSRFDEIEQVGGGLVCEVLVGHDVGVKGFAGCGFRLRGIGLDGALKPSPSP